MNSNEAKNREAIKKMANGVRIAFFLSLLTDVYDAYHFINRTGTTRQAIGIVIGILGTILLWQLSKDLRAEKKQALYYWLALLLLGYMHWIFVDAVFSLNIISIALLGLAIMLTFRLVFWMRNGALT